jgi:hypothetical protein
VTYPNPTFVTTRDVKDVVWERTVEPPLAARDAAVRVRADGTTARPLDGSVLSHRRARAQARGPAAALSSSLHRPP